MAEELHKLSLSIDRETGDISIADLSTGGSFRAASGKIQANSISNGILVNHIAEIQRILCDPSYKETRLFFNRTKSKCIQITELVEDASIEVLYDNERAIYTDRQCKQTKNYDPNDVISHLSKVYKNVILAATTTMTSRSAFVHDKAHNLLICQADHQQIVASWDNIQNGVINGCLYNGQPLDIVILTMNTETNLIDVKSGDNTLFCLPFDTSAKLVFETNSDQEFRFKI